LLVFTHSLKWVICSLNQHKNNLQIDLDGRLSINLASLPDCVGNPFPDRVHNFIISDASSHESCNSATRVAVWAWSGIISLFEIDVSKDRYEISTTVVHIPIPVDWGVGKSDATALAVVEQAASEATYTSTFSNAGFSGRLSSTNASNVDAGLTKPLNDCQICRLAVANKPSPLEGSLAVVVLYTEGSLAVDYTDGGFLKSSPGPCHLQCTLYDGKAAASLESVFSVENLHSSTHVSILGFDAHGPIVLCVSDLEIFLINGSGFIFRQERTQLRLESLISLRRIRTMSPTQYLLASNRGTFEILSFEYEPPASVSSPKIVCISDVRSAASKSQVMSCVDIINISSTSCLLIVVDLDGQVSLASLNMYTPRHITMDVLDDNPFRSQFLSTLIDIVPLPSVPSCTLPRTPFLFTDSKTKSESEDGPVLSIKHCPPRLIVCGGSGKNSFNVMEKGWPLRVMDLNSCDIGLGAGYRMHHISQSKSKSLLFFEQQEGLQSLMELSHTNDTIEALAMDIQETALDHKLERTLGLHQITLPQLSDASESHPLVVVLHSTNYRVRVLSEDCSQLLTEWDPSDVLLGVQGLVAVSVPVLSACIHGGASTFLLTVAVTKTDGSCELCILGLGLMSNQQNDKLSIRLVTNFPTTIAVSSLTMYDLAQSVGLERQRRALIAFSSWDATDPPHVTFVVAEGLPFALSHSQLQTESISMSVVFDSNVPLPTSPFNPPSPSSYEPPLISSITFLALSPLFDSANCDFENPSLVVGLTDGRLLVMDWSLETSDSASSMVVVLREIVVLEVGRQPIERLIPVDLGQHDEFRANSKYFHFALIAHSYDVDVVLSCSSPREPLPYQTRPALKDCVQVNAIVLIFGEETSEMRDTRRDLCAVSLKSDDNAADFDLDLVWQDDLGRITLGSLHVTQIARPPKVISTSGRRNSLEHGLQQPGYIHRKCQNTLTNKVSHLLYLPNLNALLVASTESVTEKCSLSILDTSTGSTAFKELWQQNLATEMFTTAISLACAPSWDATEGTASNNDGTRVDVVAIASIMRETAPPSDPDSNQSQVAILEFRRPRGADSAIAMECLGAVRISGTCFGLGLVQSRLGNDGSAVAATVDTELVVLVWACQHHLKQNKVSKSTKWRLQVEDRASSPNGGVFTSLSALGSYTAVAELQASVLVFRWSGAHLEGEQSAGRLVLVARCLAPVLSSSILLVSAATPAALPESKMNSVLEDAMELTSLRVIVADARRAGVTCLRVAPLSQAHVNAGARTLPPVAVAPEVSEFYPRRSHKGYLNSTPSDDAVAELTVEKAVDAVSSESVSLLRRADSGSFFSLGCRGTITSFHSTEK